MVELLLFMVLWMILLLYGYSMSQNLVIQKTATACFIHQKRQLRHIPHVGPDPYGFPAVGRLKSHFFMVHNVKSLVLMANSLFAMVKSRFFFSDG